MFYALGPPKRRILDTTITTLGVSETLKSMSESITAITEEGFHNLKEAGIVKPSTTIQGAFLRKMVNSIQVLTLSWLTIWLIFFKMKIYPDTELP